jgi:hypothetical protein
MRTYIYIFNDGWIEFPVEGVGRVGVARFRLEQVLNPPKAKLLNYK